MTESRTRLKRVLDAVGPRVRRDLVEEWVSSPALQAYAPLIDHLLESGQHDELADAFAQPLPFGTGGRRGHVGVGPNRFNVRTFTEVVRGHASFLHRHFEAPSVVVGWDVRAFHDVGNRYGAELGPLAEVGSSALAGLASRLYSSLGVRVYMPEDTPHYSTPRLSWAVAELQASGGLMVSASHNPPDDNGAKIYGPGGGQLIPPLDQELLDAMTLGVLPAATPAEILPIPARVESAFLARRTSVQLDTPLKARVTRLHGCGGLEPVLAGMGVEVESVHEQAAPNPRFSTVPGRVANPERPVVFDVACALGSGELVFATDPDSDRIGLSVWHQDQWRWLDGHELAILATDEVLSGWSHPEQPVVICTVVTSRLVGALARARGAYVVDDLLVGFKYIGATMDRLAGTPGRRFALGAEESHGLLSDGGMRDKDATSGAFVLACAAARQKRRNQTLVDRLEELFTEYGEAAHAQITVAAEGATGRARVENLMEGLRRGRDTFAGVEIWRDRRDPVYGPKLSDTDWASRNVVSADVMVAGCRGCITLRPSGTEPKLKVYLELHGTGARAAMPDWRERVRRDLSASLD